MIYSNKHLFLFLALTLAACGESGSKSPSAPDGGTPDGDTSSKPDGTTPPPSGHRVLTEYSALGDDNVLLSSPASVTDSCNRYVGRGLRLDAQYPGHFLEQNDGTGTWLSARRYYDIPPILRLTRGFQAGDTRDECRPLLDVFSDAAENLDHFRPPEQRPYSEIEFRVGVPVGADDIAAYEAQPEEQRYDEAKGTLWVSVVRPDANGDDYPEHETELVPLRLYDCDEPFVVRRVWQAPSHDNITEIESAFCREEDGRTVCATYELESGGDGCLIEVERATYPLLDGNEVDATLGGQIIVTDDWFEIYFTATKIHDNA